MLEIKVGPNVFFYFERGQNWTENDYLIIFSKVESKSLTHLVQFYLSIFLISL